MAYGTKYQSNFYNRFGKLVQIQLAQEDYVGGVTDIRTSEVIIEVNYKDINTPMIGTGVKIIIENEQGFGYLDELLTSKEKEFQCTIIYGGATVFKGFSVCDLNEQDFLPISKITLQFTDYLHRLDGYYMTALADMGEKSTVFEMLSDIRTEIGLHPNIHVNSTLFENSMAMGATDSFMEQVYIENSLYYSDQANYDDAYKALNKTLLSFGAFFYSYGDRWILERIEDVPRTGNWQYFATSTTGVSVASEKQEYNKQDGDFLYIDTSQKIEYNSGLQKFILNLKEKEYDSLTFNTYDPETIIPIADSIPDPGALELRKWYIYDACQALEKIYSFRRIETCLKYRVPDAANTTDNPLVYGIYYEFEVQFNVNEDVPSELNISYSMSADLSTGPVESVTLTYTLRVDGGACSGMFLSPIELQDGYTLYDPTIELSPAGLISSKFDTVASLSSYDRVWTVNSTIPLTERHVNGVTGAVHDSLWERLGRPTKQKFIITFYPIKGQLRYQVLYHGHPWQVPLINWIGDIAITVSSESTPNKITYSVNEDFITTEELDIDVFDLSSVNFCNGPMVDDGYGEYQKTNLWVSENCPTESPLMDILAKDRFRNNYRTKHVLKSTISFDGHLKPFSILTDDHLAKDSSSNLTLLLTGYTWDLNNGTYDIVAEEYTDEEIIIAEVTLDSSGNPVEGESEGSTTLTAPTISSVTQPTAGDHLLIEWTEVTGATGYRVRRSPRWYIPSYDPDNPIWAYDEREVYSGSSLFFTDDIQEEGIAEHGMNVIYRVCAYNSNVNSPYSSEMYATWYS